MKNAARLLVFTVILFLAAGSVYCESKTKVLIYDGGILSTSSALQIMEGLVVLADVEKKCSEKDPQRESYLTYVIEELKRAGYEVEVVEAKEDDVLGKTEEYESLRDEGNCDIFIRAFWIINRIESGLDRLRMEIDRTYCITIISSGEETCLGDYVWHDEDWYSGDEEKIKQEVRDKSAEKVLMIEDAAARDIIKWIKENY